MAQVVKNLPAMQETQVQSLHWDVQIESPLDLTEGQEGGWFCPAGTVALWLQAEWRLSASLPQALAGVRKARWPLGCKQS